MTLWDGIVLRRSHLFYTYIGYCLCRLVCVYREYEILVRGKIRMCRSRQSL